MRSVVQDVILPFCSDLRFPPDCLFLIFEEDFRFAPPRDHPAWRAEGRKDTSALLEAHAVGQMSPPPSGSAASSSSASPPPPTAAAEPRRVAESRPVKRSSEHFTAVHKASASDFEHVSGFVRDIVAYVTLAHRMGHGRFLWFGWQPHGAGDKGKPNVYRSGNMLVTMDAATAKFLNREWMEEDTLKHPGHADQVLKRFWISRGAEVCGYVTPPVGGYTEHVSGMYREGPASGPDLVRKDIWMEKFCCPGTRTSHDWNLEARPRFLATFTKKGGCEWVSDKPIDVDVPDSEVLWKVRDLREEQDEFRAKHDLEKSGKVPTTARQKRAARQHKMFDKFRVWAKPDEEASLKAFHVMMFSPFYVHPSTPPEPLFVNTAPLAGQ